MEEKKNEFIENSNDENQEVESSSENESKDETLNEIQNDASEEIEEKSQTENDTAEILEKASEDAAVEDTATNDLETNEQSENHLDDQETVKNLSKAQDESLEESKEETTESDSKDPITEPCQKVDSVEQENAKQSPSTPATPKMLDKLLSKKNTGDGDEASSPEKKKRKKKFPWILAAIVVLLIILPKHSHSWSEWQTTKEATCTEAGEKERTCECGSKETDAIEAIGHSLGSWTITKESTCTENGTKEALCNTCYQVVTEPLAMLAHTLDSSNKCTICGLTTFTMTAKEIEDSKKIKTMSHSVVDYSDDITINIALKDSDGYNVQVPVYVYVKIVDDNGHVLFNDTLIKKSSQSKVSIYFDDMIAGYTDIGTIYYKVYNDYVTFDEVSEELDCLPWTVDLELPELPDTIWYHSSSACQITEITFKVSGDDMYIYVTGEKTYDSNGSSYSNSCKIGWKLYDSEGYVISDGTCYTTSLKTGEKFKNEKITIYDLIEKGGSYRLVILDVG